MSIANFLATIWKKLPPPARRVITRSFQHKFTVSVAGLITNEKGELLLLDHHFRPASGWGLPGGFIMPGEQPAVAFQREIMEETGLELKNISFYRIRTLKRHVEILFRAESAGEGTIMSREIKQIRWFDPLDVPKEMNLDQQFLIKKIFQPEV